MATVKKYDLSGKEVGTVEVEDALLEGKGHLQSIKDYLVAIRKNQRQWSANTKTRAEVNRTGRKPHPQKGQGRSRQGDLAAPQYKGGGIVFGPKPKFGLHVRINQKERRAAICYLIAQKMKANRVSILQKATLKEPKTKKMATFFRSLEMSDRRTLVLGEKTGKDPLVKSLRNIPKKEYLQLPQVNGYELARCQNLIVLESAWEPLLSLFFKVAP